ncbi:heat shock transcription factor, X-linked member 4-like [Galleria mellonella]|uniref:Heat shock transcription factor, X-linked member 4-like n=1 Tax=Galleria mellonella TaxID=7137 RepID=A0A6J3BVA4_GALME|nr:heat shock transcription factor, X-linked member 4-like [Galleria mellonella]
MQEDKNAIFQMRFPQKLWYLLNMRTDAILWGGTGRTILLNYRILHNYLQCDYSIFKTTNISSFVRQLNLYGFRKVTSHLQDPLCNSSNPYMHEYVHDYFQYGRPEMLNKITRKALAMKKNFKPKSFYGGTEQMLYLTPLQKARRAFREALKKAAQEMCMQNSPGQFCNIRFESEDGQEDYCEDEENMEFDWFIMKNAHKNPEDSPQSATGDSNDNLISNETYENSSQESLMQFEDESCQQNNDIFPVKFLSMPELDSEPVEANTNVELLAGFDIEGDNQQNIVTKIVDYKKDEHNSLNCVLPSISNDPNDVTMTSMTEKKNDDSNHYHGEWDQMFNDIITCKGPNQECGSELKELYSQISRTIDLLNS